MPTIRVFLLLVLGCASLLFAVDGISVCEYWEGGRNYNGNQGYGPVVLRFLIRNDNVVKRDTIFFSDTITPQEKKHYPARIGEVRETMINHQGTLVAMLRRSITAYDGWGRPSAYGHWVSVMDINGTKMHDLAQITSGNSGGYLCWTKDGYVYYNCGDREDATSRNIFRVKVKADGQLDGPAQKVGDMNGNIWMWNVNADGSKLIYRDMGTTTGWANYQLGTGIPTRTTQGCNHYLSPSGSKYIHTTDAGHVIFAMSNWDGNSLIQYIDGKMPNDWNTNSPFAYHCPNDPVVEKVGFGCQGNKFSVNSDKWLVWGVGWSPFGRGGDCSFNQALIGYEAKKSILTSLNPRHCSRTDRIPGCTEHVDNAPTGQTGSGSFWVAGPASDINSDLVSLVDPNHFIFSTTSVQPHGTVRNVSASHPSPTLRLVGSELFVDKAGNMVDHVSLFTLRGECIGHFGIPDGNPRISLPPTASRSFIATMHLKDGVVTSAKVLRSQLR